MNPKAPDFIASSGLAGSYMAGIDQHAYLFQGLVIDKTRRILWDLKLAFLDLLAKLPIWQGVVS